MWEQKKIVELTVHLWMARMKLLPIPFSAIIFGANTDPHFISSGVLSTLLLELPFPETEAESV